MKKIEVVAAVIKYEDQILCVQRPKHKLKYISEKFEFPGGKIEENETKKDALKRELKEELDLDIEIGQHIISINHKYPDFELTMHTFLVKVKSKQIMLKEHISKQWLDKSNLYIVDWAAADIPIVDKLKTIEWQTL